MPFSIEWKGRFLSLLAIGFTLVCAISFQKSNRLVKMNQVRLQNEKLKAELNKVEKELSRCQILLNDSLLDRKEIFDKLLKCEAREEKLKSQQWVMEQSILSLNNIIKNYQWNDVVICSKMKESLEESVENAITKVLNSRSEQLYESIRKSAEDSFNKSTLRNSESSPKPARKTWFSGNTLSQLCNGKQKCDECATKALPNERENLIQKKTFFSSTEEVNKGPLTVVKKAVQVYEKSYQDTTKSWYVPIKQEAQRSTNIAEKDDLAFKKTPHTSNPDQKKKLQRPKSALLSSTFK